MNIEEILMRNRFRRCDFSRVRNTISLKKIIEERNLHGKLGLIAEYKRRSPSGFNTDEDIHSYLSYVRSHRISGLSILSEPLYFSGSFDDVILAHRLNIPVLVKDFTPDEDFVVQAYNAGGDAVLAILDFLDLSTVERIVKRALDLGMDVIEEYHRSDALKRFIPGENVILGLNRRDLNSLDIEDISTRIDYDVQILESGINITNVARIPRTYNGYLIGTSILRRDGTLEYLERNGLI